MIDEKITGTDWLKEQDLKFPNRHKEIHKRCCKHCPSNNDRKKGIKDLETEELKGLPKELIAKEYLFVCAWRTNKLCKGICDEFEIDEQFIKQLFSLTFIRHEPTQIK